MTWQQTIYRWGEDKPRVTIERPDDNFASQRRTIVNPSDYYYIPVVDNSDLLIAFTRTLTEIWVYRRIDDKTFE